MNFTLREPPEYSGSDDYRALLEWCHELYDSLWLIEFIAAQERKKQKEGTVNEGEDN